MPTLWVHAKRLEADERYVAARGTSVQKRGKKGRGPPHHYEAVFGHTS